jgi:hypothetical protein
MRIDFSSQQYGDDEQRLIRLMRAARAVVGTLFVAGLAVVAFTSPPPAAEPAPAVASAVELEVRQPLRDGAPPQASRPGRRTETLD